MHSHESLLSLEQNHLTFFYDARSLRMDAIAAFLDSEKVSLLERLIQEMAYITLGGDGLFVHVAKMAYEKRLPILGLNF